MHLHFDRVDKTLIFALGLNFALSFAQVIAGIHASSIGLIADALHNFSDVFGLLIALFARIIAKRPADNFKTFGYKRVEMVAAIINFTVMIIMGGYLIVEAIERYITLSSIDGNIVIVTSIIALLINGITTYLIHAPSKDNLNLRAAFLHSLADTLGSVGVLISGLLIHYYNLYIADIIITVVIAIYIIYQALKGFPSAINILIQTVPNGFNIEKMITDINSVDGVVEVHHIHLWQLDESRNSLEAHVVLDDIHNMEKAKSAIKLLLCSQYNIKHSTLEFEVSICEMHKC